MYSNEKKVVFYVVEVRVVSTLFLRRDVPQLNLRVVHMQERFRAFTLYPTRFTQDLLKSVSKVQTVRHVRYIQ